MKRFLLAAVAVGALVTSAVAIAGNTQVSPSVAKAAGHTGFIGGRGDGVFQDALTGSPLVFENGTEAGVPGFGYRETFAPGSYAAVPSALMTLAGLVQSASAQQLDIGYFGAHTFIFGQSTAQTILPVMDSVGLDISGDQVSGEAYEMFAGVLGASGRPAVVGLDPAFYFCAEITVADASGASDIHVGWRSATQTQTGTITTYLNYATIGAEGTSNPNTIQTMTGNDDTDVTTDTTNTWADGALKMLCVGVGATGGVSYSINGAAPTASVAFTFDDGDSLIPFIQIQHSADVAGAIDLSDWIVGYCLNDGAPTNAIGSTYPAKTVCDAVQ
jgi:hypothetical protein